MVPPPRRPKRTAVVIAVIAVVAVIAAGVGGVLLFGGGGGGGDGGSGSDVELASNPDLKRLDFPDAQALRYDEGPEAACEAVSEIMLARGYEFESAKNNDGGIDCWYGTPAASSIEDGTNYFRANVYMAVGDIAETAYDRFLSGISSQHGGGGADMTWSPLYAFPVGEEGWIVHNQDTDRGDGTSSFRKGQTTFYVTAFGWVEHGENDEALTEDVTLREITDIVTALGGGEAGASQISESMAEEYPGDLENLGEPLLPVGGAEADLCTAVTAAAEQLDVQLVGPTGGIETMGPVSTSTCTYEPADAAYGKHDVGIRNIWITQNDYTMADAMYPSGELGSHLRFTMEERGEGSGPLYALPAGQSGYFIYEDDGNDHGQMEAGYVVDDYYVTITINGMWDAGDFNWRALTEEELLDDLTLLLGAMNG
jgi:hypothetical protein